MIKMRAVSVLICIFGGTFAKNRVPKNKCKHERIQVPYTQPKNILQTSLIPAEDENMRLDGEAAPQCSRIVARDKNLELHGEIACLKVVDRASQ